MSKDYKPQYQKLSVIPETGNAGRRAISLHSLSNESPLFDFAATENCLKSHTVFLIALSDPNLPSCCVKVLKPRCVYAN